MRAETLPRMLRVRQKFSTLLPVDASLTVARDLTVQLSARPLKPGAKIAVAVGSRGITGLKTIVASVVETLKAAGTLPFIMPAMGSHGGATPAGQAEVLSQYGITESELGVPIRPSLEVVALGNTPGGAEVFCSVEAMQADGVVVINRIKPHTDFQGNLGSGLLKILVVGLGKRAGATSYHHASSRRGYELTLREMARVLLAKAPVLAGVAIVEGPRHELARVEVLAPAEFEQREEVLFREAKRLMPKLPFDDIDLLIVDQIGKNISGAGLDPNVTGRWVHGYSSSLGPDNRPVPNVRRLFVREPTPETHGNVIGIGFADFTTTRLVQTMDKQATYINAMTSMTLNSPKIPIHFDTDREAIEWGLRTLGLPSLAAGRVIRARNTLELENVEVSEAYTEELARREDLAVSGAATEMEFDTGGNLALLEK